MPQALPDPAKPPPPAPAFARPVPCRSPASSLAVVVHFQGAPKSLPRVGLVPGSPAWPPGGKRPQWKEAQLLDGAGLPTLLQSRTHAGQRLQRRPPQPQPPQPGTQPAIPHAPPNTTPSAPSGGTQLEPAKRPSQQTVPCKFPCLAPLAARSRPRAKLVPESLPWPACAGPPREPKPLPIMGKLTNPTPALPHADSKRRPTPGVPKRRPKDVAPLVRVRRKQRQQAAPPLFLARLEPPLASASAHPPSPFLQAAFRSQPRLQLVPAWRTTHPPPTLREPRTLTPRSRNLGLRQPRPLAWRHPKPAQLPGWNGTPAWSFGSSGSVCNSPGSEKLDVSDLCPPQRLTLDRNTNSVEWRRRCSSAPAKPQPSSQSPALSPRCTMCLLIEVVILSPEREHFPKSSVKKQQISLRCMFGGGGYGASRAEGFVWGPACKRKQRNALKTFTLPVLVSVCLCVCVCVCVCVLQR